MAEQYMRTLLTPSVLGAQEHYYGGHMVVDSAPERDPLTDEELGYIASRDSFYMATISENGWPYVQHRGGEPGFLKVLSPTQLAFADYKGNRQLLSTGNLAVNDRVSLFLMDYPRRERLKILGHARVLDAREDAGLLAQLTDPRTRTTAERLVVIDILSFDWNCPKYITPRYTAAEVEKVVRPLRQRIAELETLLKK
ncbi:MAG TPA: pyridoxamine 5'-phosphate oxidase family protein [Candidatus Saccharimonadales bacterium]|nr:pyridoxamine 5'-phosphate oxidase family protein [Candidatus Saccharimonadales bacterium]